MDLIKLNAVDALNMMKRGELTSEKYVTAFLDRIKVREPLVGAWNYLNHEQAIQQAKLADKRWKIKILVKLMVFLLALKT